jgi:hypothetical protein
MRAPTAFRMFQTISRGTCRHLYTLFGDASLDRSIGLAYVVQREISWTDGNATPHLLRCLGCGTYGVIQYSTSGSTASGTRLIVSGYMEFMVWYRVLCRLSKNEA